MFNASSPEYMEGMIFRKGWIFCGNMGRKDREGDREGDGEEGSVKEAIANLPFVRTIN